jgi:hypothetical protein
MAKRCKKYGSQCGAWRMRSAARKLHACMAEEDLRLCGAALVLSATDGHAKRTAFFNYRNPCSTLRPPFPRPRLPGVINRSFRGAALVLSADDRKERCHRRRCLVEKKDASGRAWSSSGQGSTAAGPPKSKKEEEKDAPRSPSLRSSRTRPRFTLLCTVFLGCAAS